MLRIIYSKSVIFTTLHSVIIVMVYCGALVTKDISVRVSTTLLLVSSYIMCDFSLAYLLSLNKQALKYNRDVKVGYT